MLERKTKEIVFNLTLDEMSVKKAINWYGQKLHFVDVATHVNNNKPLASEVLIFVSCHKSAF